MRKRIGIIAVAAVLILTLAGCESGKFDVSREKPEKETIKEVEEETVTPEPTPEPEITPEPTPEPEPEPEPMTAEDAQKIYDDFLAGNAKIKVPASADHSGEVGMIYRESVSDGSECTLNEILDALRADVMTRYEVSDSEMPDKEFKIENFSIDCGNDGMPELLVSARLLVRMDPFTEYLIVKADDDGARLCYADSIGPRSSIDINEYGYISEDGSGGASYNSFEKSFVDAKGQWHFLYGAYSEDDVAGMGILYNDEILSIPKKSAKDFKDVIFFRFWFEDKPEDERECEFSYSVGGEYDEEGKEEYSFSLLTRDESLYDAGNACMQAFDKMRIPITPLSKIDEKISEREKAEGMDESVKQGKIVCVKRDGSI